MKKTMLMVSTFGTRSGYSEHAKDIYENIKNDFDIDLIDLSSMDPSLDTGLNFIKSSDMKEQYDILITVCTLDFSTALQFAASDRFKIKINVSAGIESYKITKQWKMVSDKYDYIITSSEHSKETFINGGVAAEKVFVVSEGVDFKKFFNEPKPEKYPFIDINKKVFLTAGQIGLGNEYQERKGIWLLIKEFFKEFKDDSNACLIAKIRHGKYDNNDLHFIKHNVKRFKKDSKANVILVHGELTTEEFRNLYSQPNVIACVYPTSGEGFGRHIIESAACGKPIIAPFKTGQKDFLLQDCIYEIESEKRPVADIYKINMPGCFTEDAEWEKINAESLRKCMRQAYENPMPQDKIDKQLSYLKKEHEISKCYKKMKKLIKTLTEENKNEQG